MPSMGDIVRADMAYPHLIREFLQAMEDIGQHGHTKYGSIPGSFTNDRLNDIRERRIERVEQSVILNHTKDHVYAYKAGERHDHFHTRRHQLAAAAFNLMMEFYYARLDKEVE